jgi:hypothetical protein
MLDHQDKPRWVKVSRTGGAYGDAVGPEHLLTEVMPRKLLHPTHPGIQRARNILQMICWHENTLAQDALCRVVLSILAAAFVGIPLRHVYVFWGAGLNAKGSILETCIHMLLCSNMLGKDPRAKTLQARRCFSTPLNNNWTLLRFFLVSSIFGLCCAKRKYGFIFSVSRFWCMACGQCTAVLVQ